MSIWKSEFTLNDLEEGGKHTLAELLGIEFTEIGENYLVAKMPVDDRTVQPMRIMHGGASCALAETVGSMAANCCIDPETQQCVGLDIHTTHIRMARDGYVYGKATPISIGKTIQVWEINIVNEQGQLVSVSRLSLMTIHKRPATAAS